MKIKKYAFTSLLSDTIWCVDVSWLESFIQAVNANDLSALQIKDSKRVGFDSFVRGNVGHIDIDGPIFHKGNFIMEMLGIGGSIESMSASMQGFMDDESITDIVLQINSPGGTVTGVNEFASYIKQVGSSKPVTAYVSGMGASAAYWIASAANEIVVDQTARLGSIGVVKTVYPDDDDGSVEIVSSASPFKRPDINTDAGKKNQQEEVDNIAEVFINTVATNRGVSDDYVISNFGQGGILIGEKAVTAGMADRTGSFEGIMKEKERTDDSNSYVATSNVNNENRGQGEASMNIEELMAKHPELYKTLYENGFNAGVAEGKKDTPTVDTEAIEKKEAEIKELKDSLDAQAVKLSDLEKQEALRAEKELKAVAEAIETEKLSASSIPDRLHSKVKGRINYNSFVIDGSFDATKFSEALDSEVKDWEASLSQSVPSVQGYSHSVDPTTVKTDNEADEFVSRMLGYVQ